jgi:cobalt-zinc-cadmium resistance protein CzcA
MPVLCSFFLGGRVYEGDNWLMRFLKSLYAPLLNFSLRLRWLVVLPMLVLFAGSLLIFSRLGGELLPELDEGDLTAFAVRSASAGLTVSIEMQCQAERVLREQFPEVTHTFSRVGTDEIGSDPMNPNVSDAYIMLQPHDRWRKVNGKPIDRFGLIALMRAELLKRIPGQSYVFSQPIQMRFNEILEGTRADVAVKLFGRDFETLEQLAGEAIEVLEKIPGSGDVEPDAVGRAPALEITPDRSALRRYNLHAEDVNRVVETALAGEEVGRFVEGNRRVPIVVRLDETLRADPDAIRGLPVGEHSGGLLTLGKVAAITNALQVSTIVRENAQRRVGVLVNVRGRDLAGYVAEAERKLRETLKLPEGYTLEFGGQFQNLVAAQRRLAVVVPLALALIFVLVFFALGSLRQVLLVYTGIPLAVTGGIVALWLRGMSFTISAGVGFIALSGVAVLNGLIMISYFNTLREQGQAVHNAVKEGALTRLRPVLMTALVASFGFVPMALSHGAGAEVQRPLATVVIGGIVSSTFLTLVLLPVLYEWLERKQEPADNASVETPFDKGRPSPTPRPH